MKSPFQAPGRRSAIRRWVGFALVLALALFGLARRGCSHPTGSDRISGLDYLIVVYDMGDLNALLPVADQLDARGYRIRIVGFGQAYKALHAQNRPAYLADPVPGGDWTRQQRLTETQLKVMTAAFQPRIILTGMAATVQAQLINDFAGRASPVAFYDNFEDPRQKTYIRPFMEEIKLKPPLTFFLPSQYTERLFRSFLEDRQAPAGIDLTVTGNPSLEGWVQAFARSDPQLLRAKLAIPPGRKVAVFAGGYDPTYASSFRIFVQGTRNRPGLQILVVPHPRTDGQVEAAIIRAERARNVRLLKPADSSPEQAALCTMPALAKLADLVVCHQSSVGLQARYLGKPVLYVADPKTYGNFLIEQGLAAIAHTPAEVARALAATLAKGRHRQPSLAGLGIPRDPTGRMVAALEAALKPVASPHPRSSILPSGQFSVVQSSP